MKTIQLTQGYKTIIDDEDYEWLNQYKWCIKRGRNTIYVAGWINGRMERMHRMILDILDKPEIQGDHRNSNGLDNRRCNLRTANNAQNAHNSRKINTYGGKPTSSKYKGVSWGKSNKRWQARAKFHSKLFYLGYYLTEKEAGHAYNKFAKEHYGEFARLNQV